MEKGEFTYELNLSTSGQMVKKEIEKEEKGGKEDRD